MKGNSSCCVIQSKGKTMKKTVLVILMICAVTAPAFAGTPVLNPGNGHYYEVVEASTSWPDADTGAQAKSHLSVQGHLATITSAAEQAFVTSLMVSDSPNQHCWAGGYQPDGAAEPGGGWSWVTGETWSFTSWYPGEPNQYLGFNEDHMFLNAGSHAASGRWSDGQGPDGRWSMVEYDVEPVRTETTTWSAIKALYK